MVPIEGFHVHRHIDIFSEDRHAVFHCSKSPNETDETGCVFRRIAKREVKEK